MSDNYFEVVIKGREEFVKGFVRGVVLGRGLKTKVLFNNESGIKRDSFKERLMEFFDAPTALTHVIMDTEGVEPLTNMSHEINALREDKVGEPLDHERGLKNAPDRDTDFFKVPKIKY